MAITYYNNWRQLLKGYATEFVFINLEFKTLENQFILQVGFLGIGLVLVKNL